MKIEGTNLDKVFWPDAGLKKGDLLAYLDAVSGPILRALKDRPLTLIRYPDGIDGFSFYQKNTPKSAPPFVKTVTVRAESAKRDVSYAVCNSKDALLWLGNQAAIEFHPWTSRRDKLGNPDQLVFDFDPPEGNFRKSAEAASRMRDVMAEAGLQGAAKTSGSKGVHVYVPIQRRYHHGQVMAAADRLAARLEELEPTLVTTSFSKAGRNGRVLIDIRRNVPGQHVAAAYSPRARATATVSFPVPWEDLGTVDPGAFTIVTVPKLTANGRDPWHESLPRPQALPGALIRD